MLGILKRTPAPDPAVIARRQHLQAEIARRDQLTAELRELQAERTALQHRIDRGELTSKATTTITQRIEALSRRLDAIGSAHRRELMDTAPPSLRNEYMSLLEKKKACLAARERANRDLSTAEEYHGAAEKEYKDICERQKIDQRETWSERDHHRAQTRIEQLRREVVSCRDEADAAERKLQRVLDQIADVKQRMIDA